MSAASSPLFEPVLWDGGAFNILDEIQVPDKIEYIRVTEPAAALAAVGDMKTRAFGQVLTYLYSVALLAERYTGLEAAPLQNQIGDLTQEFCRVRPTFDFRGLRQYVDEFFRRPANGTPVGTHIATQARGFTQKIIGGRRQRAKGVAALLPNPARVLTHCNVSGELVEVARYCRELGKEFSVIATETRPYLQGARLTAWELSQAGVRVELIPDCAVAQVLAAGAVNAVIVGADRSAQNGDIINKIGTYPIALLAQLYGVPFYGLVQDPHGLKSGGDVPIEERPLDELLTFQGQALVPGRSALLRARYPAFDRTPAALITRLIDFAGVYTPEEYRQKFHATLNDAPRRDDVGKYLLVYGVPSPAQFQLLAQTLIVERAESILIPEMRPHLFGPRAVAPQLLELGVPTTLISDNMMGALFAQGEIKKLCLFYGELNDGSATGPVGSLLAAQLARLHGVAIELMVGEPSPPITLDRDVGTFMGKPICPAGVIVRPLAPDSVPLAILKT